MSCIPKKSNSANHFFFFSNSDKMISNKQSYCDNPRSCDMRIQNSNTSKNGSDFNILKYLMKNNASLTNEKNNEQKTSAKQSIILIKTI